MGRVRRGCRFAAVGGNAIAIAKACGASDAADASRATGSSPCGAAVIQALAAVCNTGRDVRLATIVGKAVAVLPISGTPSNGASAATTCADAVGRGALGPARLAVVAIAV